MRSMWTHINFPLRQLVLTAIALVVLLPCAWAQQASTTPDLDLLFARLKVTTNNPDADAIADKIWHTWLNPPDTELAQRMHEFALARTALDLETAMTLLDQLIIDHPDYAEAWNRRATLNYQLGNYQKSLDDIAETLAREPRHFGAWSGQALVYLALSDKVNAKAAAEKARAIHPFIADTPPLSELVEPRVRI